MKTQGLPLKKFKKICITDSREKEKKIKSNSLLKPEKAGKKVDDKKKQRTRQQIENRTSSGR